ncbi:MAG: glutathione peroxidase [Paracoccaceae bacterium]|nr:MAG: glutathione peroxidase [Paracoccaceae bacterium]
MGLAVAWAAGGGAQAAPPDAPFASIDGGTLSLADWAGRPVLVVNTASLCAFTPQYEGLQALYDAYRDRGLVVLAVPSDDFRQELDSAAEVRDFCAMNFDLDMPMTDITGVKGQGAHPFYAWVKAETGFAPNWNFSKVLVGADGRVAATWGPSVAPMSDPVRAAVEAALD